MKTIHKYPIKPGLQTITMHTLGEGVTEIFRAITTENNELFVYGMGDTDLNETVDIHVLVAATGTRMPFNINEFGYMDTIQTDSDVWHIFIKTPEGIDLE